MQFHFNFVRVEKSNTKQHLDPIDVMDHIFIMIKSDDTYTLTEDWLRWLAYQRVGPYPANNHPVFALLSKNNYLTDKYIKAISDIRYANGKRAFKNSLNSGQYKVDAPAEWDALFGNGDMHLKEALEKVSTISPETQDGLILTYLSKVRHDGVINSVLEQRIDNYIQSHSITDNAFKSRAIQYLESMAEDPYRNHLLVALKRAKESSQNIDAIIDYCFDGFIAYDGINNISCKTAQKERIIRVALTYGSLPLNTFGLCNEHEKMFFDDNREHLCHHLLSDIVTQLPNELKNDQRWTDTSERQQVLVNNIVLKLLMQRYNNSETARFMSRKLSNNCQWLSLLMDYLQSPVILDKETLKQTNASEAAYFNQISNIMSSVGNRSLVKSNSRTSGRAQNIINQDELREVLYLGKHLEDKDILKLTPDEWLEWSKVEGVCIVDMNEAIRQKKWYLLSLEQLTSLSDSIIEQLVEEDRRIISKIIDEIDNVSSKNASCLIDKLLIYMLEKNVKIFFQ